MKTYQSAQALGFFDVEMRVQWLEAKGNPLSRLDAVIDWERFRPLLEQALAKPAKGPGGRPAHDPLKMFKLLVVQRYYNLSDEQTEYQVSDRLTFQKFVGWTVADKVPDARRTRRSRRAACPRRGPKRPPSSSKRTWTPAGPRRTRKSITVTRTM
jgi:hypothetical protein